MEQTSKIELTFEEKEALAAALYYSMCYSRDVLDRFDDSHDSVCYQEHSKLFPIYSALYERLFGYIPVLPKGGDADE